MAKNTKIQVDQVVLVRPLHGRLTQTLVHRRVTKVGAKYFYISDGRKFNIDTMDEGELNAEYRAYLSEEHYEQEKAWVRAKTELEDDLRFSLIENLSLDQINRIRAIINESHES